MKFRIYGPDRPSSKFVSQCIVLTRDILGGLRPEIAFYSPNDDYQSGYFVKAKMGEDAYSRYRTSIDNDVVFFVVLSRAVPEPNVENALK